MRTFRVLPLIGTVVIGMVSLPVSASAEPSAGVLVDDEAAQLTGEWVRSTKQPALAGPAYRHDNNQGQGRKSARFTPTTCPTPPAW